MSALMRLLAQLRQNLQERFDDPRIECLARLLFDQRRRRFGGDGLVIRPVGGQRIVELDDAQYARPERHLLALAAGRIAVAVPALVMIQDERRDGLRKRHRGDDFGADLRMNADLLKLLGRERTRLGENVLGYGQLADVVQQCGGFDGLRSRRRTCRAPWRDLLNRSVRGGCDCAPCGLWLRWRAPAPPSLRGAALALRAAAARCSTS